MRGMAVMVVTSFALWATLSAATPARAGQIVTGDVDCNGRVESIDAALVLQNTSDLLGHLPCPLNARADGYPDVTSVDATLILQFAAGLFSQLPPVRVFTGDIVVVRGAEAYCTAVDTGSEVFVLWEPRQLMVGQRVRVTGYLDSFLSFCGISPLLHNLDVEVLN
jgi:hypothetical protein